jgi:hypothetical protein
MIANTLHQAIGGVEVAGRLADAFVSARSAHLDNCLQCVVDMCGRFF